MNRKSSRESKSANQSQ